MTDTKHGLQDLATAVAHLRRAETRAAAAIAAIPRIPQVEPLGLGNLADEECVVRITWA